LQIFTAGLVTQAYGTFVAVWKVEFGWSASAFSVAFALQRGMMALLSPIQGHLLQRLDSRRVIQVGLVILSLGLALLSRFDTQTEFYLAYLLMALGVGLSGFLSLTVTVVNWFERRRSSALALVQVGISIGGLLVPVVAWMITRYGWRATSLASGLLVFLIGLPLSALLRRSPEANGKDGNGLDSVDRVCGTSSRDLAETHRRDFGTREALKTRAFWLITAGHATAVTATAAVTVHIVVHLHEELGFSLQTAASVVALLTGATLAGQLLGGYLGDRFPKRTIAAFAMLGHSAALLVVAFATNIGMVLLFASLHGLCWGVRGPIMQAIRADYFGRSSFATIMGISFSFVMIGQMLGPLMAGRIADTLGSYKEAFVLLAAIVGLGSLFFMLASPPKGLYPEAGLKPGHMETR